MLRERFRAPHEVQRRLAFGARFRENQRPVLEVEREQTHLARNRCSWRLPSEPPGDHQVKDEEKLAFGFEHHTLAEAFQPDNRPALDR